MEKAVLMSEKAMKQTVVQVSGRNVTLVFNKNGNENALGMAKEMLTNSYANSLFTVSVK